MPWVPWSWGKNLIITSPSVTQYVFDQNAGDNGVGAHRGEQRRSSPRTWPNGDTRNGSEGGAATGSPLGRS